MFSLSFPYAWSWVSGCWSTEDCSWNPLLYTSSAFLILSSLLTASFRSATCCVEVLLLDLPCAGRFPGCLCYMTKAQALTAALGVSCSHSFQQLWMEVPDSSGIDRGDSLSGAAAFKTSVIMLSRQLLLNLAGPTYPHGSYQLLKGLSTTLQFAWLRKSTL